MLRSILVGLDGSDVGQTAVDLGIRWAQQREAVLAGIGIVDEPSIRHSEPMPLGGGSFKEERDEARLADARLRVAQFLEGFSTRCTAAGVANQTIQATGQPAQLICQESQRFDLVLLGKKTYFHFETQNEPDDTLSTVLTCGPRPVVTVPEKIGEGSSIVIAYDGSLQSARTLQTFQSVMLNPSQEVHVVSVHGDAEEATKRADRALSFLAFHQVQAQRHVLISTTPAKAILEQVARLNAGLLVMGAYGQPAMREFFFGSVTRSILREQTVPLFLSH